MEINSVNSYPTGPDRRPKVNADRGDVDAPQSDSFSGPNIEAKKSALKNMDGVREDKVLSAQKELQSGDYFTEERIRLTVEKLLAGL